MPMPSWITFGMSMVLSGTTTLNSLATLTPNKRTPAKSKAESMLWKHLQRRYSKRRAVLSRYRRKRLRITVHVFLTVKFLHPMLIAVPPRKQTVAAYSQVMAIELNVLIARHQTPHLYLNHLSRHRLQLLRQCHLVHVSQHYLHTRQPLSPHLHLIHLCRHSPWSLHQRHLALCLSHHHLPPTYQMQVMSLLVPPLENRQVRAIFAKLMFTHSSPVDKASAPQHSGIILCIPRLVPASVAPSRKRSVPTEETSGMTSKRAKNAKKPAGGAQQARKKGVSIKSAEFIDTEDDLDN